MGVQNLKVFLDSELVSRHVNGTFEVKRMKVYYDKVVELLKILWGIDIQAIKREINTWADVLAKEMAYGDSEKKNEITTCTVYPSDIHVINIGREDEKATMKDAGWSL